MICLRHRTCPELLLLELDCDSLEGQNLSGAYLKGAAMSGMRCARADLRRANLERADLRGADLRGTALAGAILCGADLREANLQGADLGEADLTGADLRRANLRGVNLTRANLTGADLRGVIRDGRTRCSAGILAESGGILSLRWRTLFPKRPTLPVRGAPMRRNWRTSLSRQPFAASIVSRWSLGWAPLTVAAAAAGILVLVALSEAGFDSERHASRPAWRPTVVIRPLERDAETRTERWSGIEAGEDVPLVAITELVPQKAVERAMPRRRSDGTTHEIASVKNAAARKFRSGARTRKRVMAAAGQSTSREGGASRQPATRFAAIGSQADSSPAQPQPQVAWGNGGFHYGSGYDIYQMHLPADQR